ncbi:MAG: hypothetical protein ABIS86_10105, partial [Streptosporangiaceae bacterium]
MTAPTQAQFQRTFYRWGGDSRLGNGAGPGLWPVSSSLASRAALRSWHRRIEPWLRTAPGNAPAPNHFYGAFGSEAIMIRREQTADPESATAQLLIGPAEFLTPADALELRDWQWRPASRSTGLAPLDLARLDVHRSDLRARAGSAPVAKRLGPLLSQALAGPAAVLSPLSQYAEPLLWGIQEIIVVLFEGLTEEQRWPLSFVTHDDRPRSQEQPGLFIRFRDDAPRVTAHPVYGALAGRLVTEYVRHGINGLRALTAEPALQSLGPQARIDLLLHQLSGEPVPRRPSTPGERVTPTETSRTPTGGG